ncbi:MAG: error-prone DNA polymerase [Thioalkalivibrionaceae bacterium]
MSNHHCANNRTLGLRNEQKPVDLKHISNSNSWAELSTLSNFTFLEGASHPEELIERAAALGYTALALTDECSLAGIVRAHQAARRQRLNLILGARFKVATTPIATDDTADDQRSTIVELQPEQTWQIVVLVRNANGYAALCRLITDTRRNSPKGHYHLDVDLFARALETAGPDAWAILIDPPDDDCLITDHRLLAIIENSGCEEYALAAAFERTQRDAARRHRVEALTRTRKQASGITWRIAAVGDIRYHARGRRALHDTLRAIRARKPLHGIATRLAANGERHLRTPESLTKLYPYDWRITSLNIAAQCRFSLDELRYPYPQDAITPFPDGRTALNAAVAEGARQRWPDGVPERIQQQLDYELALIHELHYEAYFLTVYDIVREARRRGILCQGRGSAANSAVCYALGITAVDPARSHMLFERFISKERAEPPDIDVDFEHQRREEIFQYVWTRYGRDRAALAAAVIRYRRRSALRDVGRALGLSKAILDALTANLAWWDDGIPHDRLAEVGIDPDGALARQWHRLATDLLGFPRHLSQHTGGFVIAAQRLDELVPIENAAMPERTVIQWDKTDLDAAGLMKIDLLALGMLSALRRALNLLTQLEGRARDLADIPAEDPVVYERLSCGDAIGVFQIESRAQLAMLPRLRPRCFYDLVIEVAIVRPGPIQGEMVHPYLRRRQGLDPITYPSEAVRQVLERTLGVPIFQEQIIQLAVVAAGFSAGEADGLRRAIGAWRSSGALESYRSRLLDGLRRHGYPESFAEQIYQQILGFGEYGFPESHAASFALLTYISAWFKVHHPAIYLCALLNSQPMGFYSPWQLIQDAQRHGVVVEPIDVQHSGFESRLEFDTQSPDQPNQSATAPTSNRRVKVRLGLSLIRGLKRSDVETLISAREERPFRDLQDLRNRTRLAATTLQRLAAAGALRAWQPDRHASLWSVQDAHPAPELWQASTAQAAADSPKHADSTLYTQPAPASSMPVIQQCVPACSTLDQMALDLTSTGLTLGPHPLAWLRPTLPESNPPFLTSEQLSHAARHAAQKRPQAAQTTVSAIPQTATPRSTMPRNLDRRLRVRTLGLVVSRQRPHSAHGTVFLSLEDEFGTINVIIWPDRVEHHRRAILHGRLVEVIGQAEHADNTTHVIAERLIERNDWLGQLDLRTRAFG